MTDLDDRPLADLVITTTTAPSFVEESGEVEMFLMVDDAKMVGGDSDGLMNLLTTYLARDKRFDRYFSVYASGWKTLQEGNVVSRGLVYWHGFRHP